MNKKDDPDKKKETTREKNSRKQKFGQVGHISLMLAVFGPIEKRFTLAIFVALEDIRSDVDDGRS